MMGTGPLEIELMWQSCQTSQRVQEWMNYSPKVLGRPGRHIFVVRREGHGSLSMDRADASGPRLTRLTRLTMFAV